MLDKHALDPEWGQFINIMICVCRNAKFTEMKAEIRTPSKREMNA
jgi:hypothetical protein